jgi:hypothetical protein
LTVRDFEVLISLGLKIGKMHFLKVQKRPKNASKKTPKNRVQNRPKSPKSPIKQGVQRRCFFAKNTNKDEATIDATPCTATYTWESASNHTWDRASNHSWDRASNHSWDIHAAFVKNPPETGAMKRVHPELTAGT